MCEEASRLHAAVAVLQDGGTMRVGDVRLALDGNELTVTGWTTFHSLENVTRARALVELNEIKAIFAAMLEASPELRRFAATRAVSYHLDQEHGQGAIGICSEVSGTLTWHAELKV